MGYTEQLKKEYDRAVAKYEACLKEARTALKNIQVCDIAEHGAASICQMDRLTVLATTVQTLKDKLHAAIAAEAHELAAKTEV